jgi:hypothetical protein
VEINIQLKKLIEPHRALKRRGFRLRAGHSFLLGLVCTKQLSDYTFSAMGRTTLPGNQDTGFQTRLLHLRFQSSLSCRPRERLRPATHENFPDFSSINYPSTFNRGFWTKTMWFKHLLPRCLHLCISLPHNRIIAHLQFFLAAVKTARVIFPPRFKNAGLPDFPYHLGVQAFFPSALRVCPMPTARLRR